MSRKNFDDILSNLDTEHEWDRQADRQTPEDGYAKRRAVKTDRVYPTLCRPTDSAFSACVM